jgi:hypothetical protein
LARLGVARADALESRTSQGADADAARVRALAAYKDFLALWKDADPDVPILKVAKGEYAKLQIIPAEFHFPNRGLERPPARLSTTLQQIRAHAKDRNTS